MYRFDIEQQKDGTWKFELDGINLIVDGFAVDNNKHVINNPHKAIAYFNIEGHLYGLSNQVRTCGTAEEFYDIMRQQFAVFKSTVSVNRKESDKLLQAS
jgi:hypothetical protein